jgi:hypothetical protein
VINMRHDALFQPLKLRIVLGETDVRACGVQRLGRFEQAASVFHHINLRVIVEVFAIVDGRLLYFPNGGVNLGYGAVFVGIDLGITGRMVKKPARLAALVRLQNDGSTSPPSTLLIGWQVEQPLRDRYRLLGESPAGCLKIPSR